MDFDQIVSTMAIDQSVYEAFKNVNPSMLRQWYVNTIALDQANLDTMYAMETPRYLKKLNKLNAWPSVEHQAIGSRLIWMGSPDLVARPPDLMEITRWDNEIDLTDTLFYVFEPWRTIRYDPEGENWYSLVQPGQWKRHGKGAPSRNMVNNLVQRWLRSLHDNLMDFCAPWPIDPSRYETADIEGEGEVTAAKRPLICRKRLDKFTRSAARMSNIRGVMEAKPIMFLDTSTMGQVRTIAPFANGAVCLVDETYSGVGGVLKQRRQGDLLPLDPEYMVMNANSLPWLDLNKTIPDLFQIAQDTGDWTDLTEHEYTILSKHAPTYYSFLKHAFPEGDEREAFLRLLGAAMYGSNLKIVAAMIGEPNAGKDTVVNWLSYLMPGQVAALPFSAFTPHGDDDRGFASLMGARVAVVSGEVGEGRGNKLLAEKLKTVSSGGGTLRVAEKYEKPTTIHFDGMLFLQGNSVPTIQGGDAALYRNRIVAVEFKHPWATVSRSYEAAYRHEAAHFAQVLFIHYLRYHAMGGGMVGLNPPETWRAFAQEFASTSNPHGFLEGCIIPSQSPIPTSQFHAALSTMAEKFGSPFKVGQNYWPKRIKTRYQFKGDNSIRKQTMVGGQRVLSYYLTIDASLSDGAFTQQDWEHVLQNAAVVS